MVFLHAMEHGVEPPRVSTDLDVLVNARVVTGGVREFVKAIEAVGFQLVGTSPEGLAHRYARDDVSVDVLAPEGLGPRTDLTTTPPGRTLQVPGGTQALDRTELVPVTFGGQDGFVPRPSLLGAIVGKAMAVDIDDVPEAQRLDLALLLSLVDDPLETAEQLTKKDRQRLRTRSEMADADQRAWSNLPDDLADRGRAAYLLLMGDTPS
jgi:predicted nucleotidyltransferase